MDSLKRKEKEALDNQVFELRCEIKFNEYTIEQTLKYLDEATDSIEKCNLQSSIAYHKQKICELENKINYLEKALSY